MNQPNANAEFEKGTGQKSLSNDLLGGMFAPDYAVREWEQIRNLNPSEMAELAEYSCPRCSQLLSIPGCANPFDAPCTEKTRTDRRESRLKHYRSALRT